MHLGTTGGCHPKACLLTCSDVKARGKDMPLNGDISPSLRTMHASMSGIGLVSVAVPDTVAT